MILARVLGSVTATVKPEALRGVKLMVVQPLDDSGAELGAPEVACDTVGVGLNELVFLCGGPEASLPLPEPFAPVDLTIVGRVDETEASP